MSCYQVLTRNETVAAILTDFAGDRSGYNTVLFNMTISSTPNSSADDESEWSATLNQSHNVTAWEDLC